MTWDALQRELLAALGHTVYVMADAPATQRHERDVGPRAADRLGASNPLLRALLHAANLGEDGSASLQPHLPSLQTLTGNPAAKRALWPTLRALRATPGPGAGRKSS